jgi:hypothetical protein
LALPFLLRNAANIRNLLLGHSLPLRSIYVAELELALTEPGDEPGYVRSLHTDPTSRRSSG